MMRGSASMLSDDSDHDFEDVDLSSRQSEPIDDLQLDMEVQQRLEGDGKKVRCMIISCISSSDL